MQGHVVAMGGGGFLSGELQSPLDDLLLSFSPRQRPRVSFCPHFDGEQRRRPVSTRLVADGFPPGIACDDGAAAVCEGAKLREVVSERPSARGYRVTPAGAEPIATRLLR